MHEVTRILASLESGDGQAAAELLPLVYAELRRLAGRYLNDERVEHTLQPTALVHEAYLRLVDSGEPQAFHNRGHFFAAAAEGMRRILVEHARARGAVKRGGQAYRQAVNLDEVASLSRRDDLLALDEALDRLESVDPRKASLVKLRYFSGLTMQEAANALDISIATAERDWAYSRVWLLRELTDLDEQKPVRE